MPIDLNDQSTDRDSDFDDAEQELQQFSAEFQRIVGDLPAQRAIKDIDQLLKAFDELARQTIYLGSPPAGLDEQD